MYIRNSIDLQDRMTPVFRSIIKAMDSTLKVMKNLDRQANNGAQSKAYKAAEKDIQKANNQLIKMQNHLDKADKAAGKLASAAGGISRAFTGLSTAGFNLMNFAAALYLLRSIKNVISSIMEAPDSARATQARLGLFNKSSLNNDRLYEQVYKTALDTRTGLEETGNLATRILISGAIDGEDNAVGAIKTTKIINKALVAGGGTAEENKRALLQLSQGLASGVLQGDELRAIREQTPYLTKILAEGLGKIDPKFVGTTIGDLKKLGADGELTADRIIKAFSAMEGEINSDFEKMPKTFEQSMTQIRTVWEYFLFLLSKGDGALAKVNNKMWELADYLASPQGVNTLSKIAALITLVVDGAINGINLIIQGATWLEGHLILLQSLFFGLAGIAIAAAFATAAAWWMANWPIALMFLAITGLVYLFLSLGYTAQDIAGKVAGAFAGIAAVVIDAVLVGILLVYSLFSMLWDTILWTIVIVGLAVVGFYQLLLWGWQIVKGLFTGVAYGIGEFIYAIYGNFVWLADNVLTLMYNIASAIDLVFGSNLASTVSGWMTGLNSSLDEFGKKVDSLGEKAKDDLTNFSWDTKGTMEGIIKYGVDNSMDPAGLNDWAMKNWKDPSQWAAAGESTGRSAIKQIEDALSNSGLASNQIQDLLSGWDGSSVSVNGGDLDSVGSIKSDVNLSSEDIQLLRDIAARDFLLNIQTNTPTVYATFGDVRETADVGAIMDVIEDMVDERLATSLVTE